MQVKAHAAAQAALREELAAEAAAVAAQVSGERLRKLDDALSDRSARLLQDNARLRAELKVHAEVPLPTLGASCFLSPNVRVTRTQLLVFDAPDCRCLSGKPSSARFKSTLISNPDDLTSACQGPRS